MKYTEICLASTFPRLNMLKGRDILFVLETYWAIKQDTKKVEEFMEWVKTADRFILDSGAFTFMNQSKKGNLPKKLKNIKMEDYAHNYASFINKYDIDYFIELDVDTLYSYDYAKELRAIIEEETGKKSIPVYHYTRGEEGWADMCDNYDFVAIGDITRNMQMGKDYGLLNEMCDYAHAKGCRVHGLGFTRIPLLNKYECPFDSVDSTTWLGIQGQYFTYDEEQDIITMEPHKKLHWKDISENNYQNWQKFAKKRAGI